MNLRDQFFKQIALRDAAKNTGRDYWALVMKFYRFIQKPASEWTGEDVEAWMWELHRMEYARKSRTGDPPSRSLSPSRPALAFSDAIH